jgi:hypothetical protein
MIVFAALAAGRWIEAQAGWPIRNSGKTARRYRNIQIQAGLRTITAADPSPTTSAKHAPPSAPRPAVCTNLSQVRSQKPMHEIRVHGHHLHVHLGVRAPIRFPSPVTCNPRRRRRRRRQGLRVIALSRRRGGPEPVGEGDDEFAEFVGLLDGEWQVE